MDYKKLLDTILGLDASDLAVISKLESALRDLSHPDAHMLSTKLKEFDGILSKIDLLSTLPLKTGEISPRDRFIGRLERLSRCEQNALPRYISKNVEIQPYFKKYDVIYCDFGGVGKELDGPHYAIVWEDTNQNEEITVIPTTSQFIKETETTFSVGRITGLTKKDTILSVHKMIRISRKRALICRGVYIQGKLLAAWASRIEWAIASFFGGEKTLHYHVRESCGDAIPDRLGTYSSARFSPIRDFKYDDVNSIVTYRLWNDVHVKSYPVKRPTSRPSPDMKDFKKKLLDNYYSGDLVRKTSAETAIQDYY